MNLSTEYQFLLTALHAESDVNHVCRLPDTVAKGDDSWIQILYLAKYHGVVSLLHHRLCEQNLIPIPTNFRRSLTIAALLNQRACARQWQELRNLAKLFRAADIPIIPYKGVFLSQTLYGDMHLRDSGDIDLIIHPSDFAAARQLLIQNGYIEVKAPFGSFWRRFARIRHNDQQFVNGNGSITLELHWNITNILAYSRYTLNSFWPNLIERSLENEPILEFSNTDLLLTLCLHGTKHEWARLKWLADVHQLICMTPLLEWDSVIKTARRYGIYRRFCVGLWMAKRLLQSPIPSEISQRHVFQKGIERIAEKMACAAFTNAYPPHRFNVYKRRVFLYEQPRDRLIYLIGAPASMVHAILVERRVPNALRRGLKR